MLSTYLLLPLFCVAKSSSECVANDSSTDSYVCVDDPSNYMPSVDVGVPQRISGSAGETDSVSIEAFLSFKSQPPLMIIWPCQ